MKNRCFFILLSLTLALSGVAQQIPPGKSDSAAIVQTALDYADGFYSGSAERMERAIHPDLNKVVISTLPQTGKSFLRYSSYSILIELCRAKAGLLDKDKRNITVKILLIEGDIACVRMTSAQFNDYLAMVKIDDQWKIINVLWTEGPDSKQGTPLTFCNSEPQKSAIIKTVQEMIEGFYSGDGELVKKVFHQEGKRTTPYKLPQTGKVMIIMDGAGYMTEVAAAGLGKKDPDTWEFDVQVLDCMNNLAFALLSSPTGDGYLQLANIDGHWMIINYLKSFPIPPPSPGK